MKNSIILPTEYEKIFLNEAKKENLVKYISNEKEFLNEVVQEEQKLSRKYKRRQELFQMLLLYDEVVIPGSDPIYDLENMNNMENVTIYSFDDFAQSEPLYEEGYSVFAEYLKPMLMQNMEREFRKLFPIKDRYISYRKLISELYDSEFGIKKQIDEKCFRAIEKNMQFHVMGEEEAFRELFPVYHENKLSTDVKENLFYSYIYNMMRSEYAEVSWLLELSTMHESYLVNFPYDLSKIGCEGVCENVTSYLEAYKVLKCECASLIGNLPRFNSLSEVFDLKEKRRNDIKNLKDQLNQLEYVLRNEGKEKAILKASKDVMKASEALSKRNDLAKVGKWTTLFSVPVGVCEAIFSLPSVGFLLSIIGTAACIADEFTKSKYGWCEIVR